MIVVTGTLRNDLGYYDETKGADRESPKDEGLTQILTSSRYISQNDNHWHGNKYHLHSVQTTGRQSEKAMGRTKKNRSRFETYLQLNQKERKDPSRFRESIVDIFGLPCHESSKHHWDERNQCKRRYVGGWILAVAPPDTFPRILISLHSFPL